MDHEILPILILGNYLNLPEVKSTLKTDVDGSIRLARLPKERLYSIKEKIKQQIYIRDDLAKISLEHTDFLNRVNNLYNSIEICKIMLNKNVHVPKNNNLYYLGIKNGDQEFINSLKQSIYKEYIQFSNRTLLNAIDNKRLYIAMDLIINNYDTEHVYDPRLLINALENDLDDVAMLLIERRIDLNARDYNKKTAMSIAIKMHKVSIVEKLVKKVILELRYLNMAIKMGSIEIVKILLKEDFYSPDILFKVLIMRFL